MSDQTVSLKLEMNAEDLKRAVNDSGKALDDMAGKGTDAGHQIEASVSGAEDSVHGLSGALGDIDFASLGGAAAGLGIASVLDDAVVSSGRLQAQLGLTKDEAEEFDQVAREVYADNFGDTMGEASEVVGQVHQSLDLTGDALKETTEGVFAISDAFGHLGADSDIILEGVRNLTANFDDLSESDALDLIASGFQNGLGAAGDLQDTLQEYPGDFARLGLDADDMFGILDAGMEAGARDTDILADAVREMGIRITTAGDTGQEALAKLFPEAEAQRLISDFAAGGEAGRDAFFTVADALTAVVDPQERYNLAVEIMGTRGEELANILPDMNEALGDVRDGTYDADGAAESLNAQYSGMRDTLEGWRRAFETSFLAPLGSALGPVAELGTGFGTMAFTAKGAGIELGAIGRRVGPFAIATAAIATSVYAVRDAFLEGAEAGREFDGTLSDWAEEEAGSFDRFGSQLKRLVVGGPIGALANAAEDSAEMWNVWQTSADGAGDSANTLLTDLGTLAAGQNDAEGETDEYTAAIEDQEVAQIDTTTAAERHTDALGELMDRQREAVDPVFALEEAMSRYDDVANDADATSWDVARAISDVERAAMDGDLSFGEFDRKLQNWVDSGHLTEAKADDIRDSVGEMREEAEGWAGDYDANLRLSVEMSQADLNMADRWTAAAEAAARHGGTVPSSGGSSSSEGLNTAATRNALRRAEGGPVWPDEWFMVGEEGPEMVQFPAHGQVYSAPDTAQMLRGGDGSSAGRHFEITQNFNVKAEARDHFKARDEIRRLNDWIM